MAGGAGRILCLGCAKAKFPPFGRGTPVTARCALRASGRRAPPGPPPPRRAHPAGQTDRTAGGPKRGVERRLSAATCGGRQSRCMWGGVPRRRPAMHARACPSAGGNARTVAANGAHVLAGGAVEVAASCASSWPKEWARPARTGRTRPMQQPRDAHTDAASVGASLANFPRRIHPTHNRSPHHAVDLAAANETMRLISVGRHRFGWRRWSRG